MFNKAAIYAITGGFLFVSSGALVRFIPNIPATEITFFRCLVTLFFCYSLLRKKRISPWGNNKVLLLMRGGFGAIGLTLFYWTIQNLPLVVAITVQDLSAFFTILISIWVLKEYPARYQWICFGIALVGVFLTKDVDAIVEQSNSLLSGYPIVVGVFSAFLGGCAYNCVRKLKSSEDTLVIVFYFPLVALPLVGSIMVFEWVTPSLFEVAILLTIGALVQAAQFLITKAMQTEKLVVVMNYSFLGIVYSFGFGLLLGDSIDTVAIGGIGLIVFSAILNGVIEQKPSISRK